MKKTSSTPSSFTRRPEVAAKMKPFRPRLSRAIGVPLRVAPRTTHYALIGTAFDYLLRFELQRRAPHALAGAWAADSAPDIICREVRLGITVGLDLIEPTSEHYAPPQEIAERMRTVLNDAHSAVRSYLINTAPNHEHKAELARHAMRLAKLDPVLRVRRLDPRFEDVDSEDQDDLLNLLDIVPFTLLVHGELLILNPVFRNPFFPGGGADTDLITGDLIVDIKTTKSNSMDADQLDEILGYLLHARHQRGEDPTFPEIKRLGFYFSRHGHLWMQDVSLWTENPNFTELENWFFEHAHHVRETQS